MKCLFRVFGFCFILSMILTLHVRAANETDIVIMVDDESGTYEGNVSIIFNFQSGPETVDFDNNEIGPTSARYVSFPSIGDVVVKTKLDSDNWIIVDKTSEEPLEVVNLEHGSVCILNLVIREKQTLTESSDDYGDLFNFDNVQPTEKEVKTYDIEEGYQLFRNYLDASSFLRDGSYDEWMLYNALMTLEGVHLTTNLSDDEWNSLSQYEQFVYTVTYIQLAFFKASDLDAMFIKPNQEGIPEDYKSMYLKCPKADEETQKKYMNAVEEFMTWQMGYFRQNGYPYDFVRGMSYAEEVMGDIGSNKPQEESITDKELEEVLEVFENEFSDEEKKEIVEAAKDYIEKENTTDIVPKVGDKNEKANTSDSLPILIIALVVFGVLVAIIVFVIAIVSKDKKVEDKSNNENN